MLKQSPSRNQRTKGFNLKHVFQVFILIAVGIWLLYQLKRSYDKKVYDESSAKIFGKLEIGHETIKLGRKGFQPRVKTEDDLIDDAEDSKLEKMKRNDLDRAEEEETEEVEDLIDDEDKEREEEESEDLGKQIEDIGLLEDQEQNAEASGKHHKENGASREVTQETQSSRRKVLQQKKKCLNLIEDIVSRIDPSPKVIDVETIEHGSFAEGIGNVLDLADS